MKKPFRIKSLTAVTLLLAGLALILWLVGMYLLTALTAELAADRYLEDSEDRAELLARNARLSQDWEDPDRDQNFWERAVWEAVNTGEFAIGDPIISGSSGFLQRQNREEVFWANAVYDAQGNYLAGSWEDFFYFTVLTEDQWKAGEELSRYSARAPFRRDKLVEGGLELVKYGFHFDAAAMRFTGTFDGTEMTLTRVEYISRDELWDVLPRNSSYTVSNVVEEAGLTWHLLYEDPEAVPAGAELVTLYTDNFDVCCQDRTPSFSYRGTRYDSVAGLVVEVGPTLAEGTQNLSRYEGGDLLIFSTAYYMEYEGEGYLTDYHYGDESYIGYQTGDVPELQFYVVSAVWCSPWDTAMGELRNIYLITFGLTVLLVLCVRAILNRRLIRPVREVSWGLNHPQTRAEPPYGRGWREPVELCQGYYDRMEQIRLTRNELTRLKTALDYAKTAEANRRQMTSNIAHELKTPLAVIHSYVEGLKEHIAEEKRDKYLDVILAETGRVDAMVLEMLDLSRLEAGKVKLARDTFSLTKLTRSIFDRLERAAEEKELKLTLDLKEECIVNADESRMAQVVENLASNAVKYTPEGGSIWVQMWNSQGATWFTIENTCTPLSQEELDHVWDTFFRGDQARSGGGTGLGLAIVKNIVELHGGKCFARSTSSGVVFSFWI